MYDKYLEELKKLIKFKSISTDPQYKPELIKTAQHLENYLKNSNFTTETWDDPRANPVVFATYTHNPEAKTILIYGHYDVQPASGEWYNDPFEVFEKDKKLYARGIVDNKGQHLIHLVAISELIKQNTLKYNVKVLIEGNEETSNDALPSLIEKNREKLKCDYVLISDGEVINSKPSIEMSLRGGFNCKIIFKTANNNLHSGLYGGAVPNAAIELTKLLDKLFNEKENNKVMLNGFYDDVEPISQEILQNNAELSSLTTELIPSLGIKTLITKSSLDLYSQIGLMPTVEITGLKSGYIEAGYANIVPCEAEARLNFRTVKNMDNAKVQESLKDFLKIHTPNYVTYSIEFTNAYDAVKVPIDSEIVTETEELLKKAYSDKVYYKPVGGGIPVVSDFKELLNADSLLIPLGNDDCNMHGVNENFDIDLIKKALTFSELFFKKG